MRRDFTSASSFRRRQQQQQQRDVVCARWLMLSLVVLALSNHVAECEGVIVSTTTTTKTPKMVSLPLIPHHEQKRRRQRRALDDNSIGVATDESQASPPLRRPRRRLAAQVIDALYQGYGTHYVDLWCGTPTPQRQTVIVDTGSSVTAFPCLGCQSCGDDGHHLDHLYNQSSSNSFVLLNCSECHRGHCQHNSDGMDEWCRLGMSYQEGSSWSAFESIDICYAGGPHDHALAVSTISADSDTAPSSSLDDVDPRLATSFAFPMTFGCQTRLTGLFKTQLADGIMGMDNVETSFWSQMHRAGKIEDEVFSLCFSRQDVVERDGTEAGAMTLGGTDPRLHNTPMVYATNINGKSGGKGFFAVHVRRVYLRKGGGGDSASPTTNVDVVALDVSEKELNRGTTIVDSGTTDTYFDSVISKQMSKIWTQLSGQSYNPNPVSLTTDQLNNLPTILLQLSGDEITNTQVLNNTKEGEAVTGLAGSLDEDHPLDIIVAIPPSHYMEYDDRAGLFFHRFYSDEGPGTVLGANTMMGHDVYFDVPNARIGFAESRCSYAQLLESAHVPADDPGDGGSHATGTEKKELPGDDDATKKEPEFSFPSAIAACKSLKCRGAVAGSFMGIVLLGLFVGRSMAARRRRQLESQSSSGAEYHLTSELELSDVVVEEEDDFVQYRDVRQPPDDGVDDDENPTSEKIMC